MQFYVADAFTRRPFSGNQAGVVFLGDAPFPQEALMRALAGELKHSETAFVRRTGEGFHIRYFTPAEEVDLCGHATVAAFTVLRETGEITAGRYMLRTRSGILEVAAEPTPCGWTWPRLRREEAFRRRNRRSCMRPMGCPRTTVRRAWSPRR